MIQSLKIRNYKNLSGLSIPKLSRINLISGKNNVGKSSLLEAIGIYIDDSELLYVIEERGEYPKYINRDITDYLKPNIDAIASIFANRNTGVSSDNIIEISDNEDILLLRFVYYTEQETEENGNIVRKAIVFDSEDDLVAEDATAECPPHRTWHTSSPCRTSGPDRFPSRGDIPAGRVRTFPS